MANDTSLLEVQRTYARWAPMYDSTHFLLPFRKTAVHGLNLQAGQRVLDVACGTGLNFSRLQAGVGPSGQVVGVDLSPAMLQVARRRVERAEWANVSVEEGDAARLPFGQGTFDAVLCTYALNIIPRDDEAIREAFRVLRPGGRFVVADTDLHRMRSILHRLPCAVHLGRNLVFDVGAVFSDVDASPRWGGRFVLIVARRT